MLLTFAGHHQVVAIPPFVRHPASVSESGLNAGRRVTRVMIIEHVWNLSFDTTTNVIDVYVNYLRRKIDDGYGKRLIHTVRGVGYELSAREAA